MVSNGLWTITNGIRAQPFQIGSEQSSAVSYYKWYSVSYDKWYQSQTSSGGLLQMVSKSGLCGGLLQMVSKSGRWAQMVSHPLQMVLEPGCELL